MLFEPKIKKDKVITLRITLQEHLRLLELAKQSGKTLSKYLRDKLLEEEKPQEQ
jgi:predicted DNA-binding protein